jgi:hypothetical protein
VGSPWPVAPATLADDASAAGAAIEMAARGRDIRPDGGKTLPMVTICDDRIGRRLAHGSTSTAVSPSFGPSARHLSCSRRITTRPTETVGVVNLALREFGTPLSLAVFRPSGASEDQEQDCRQRS